MIEKKNQEIRNLLGEKNIPQYKLADLLGISESTLVRHLRKELSEEEKQEYIKIITKYTLEERGKIKMERDNISLTSFCKMNNINRNTFIEYLKKNKYIYSQPYGKDKEHSKNIAFPKYDTKNGVGYFEMNENKNSFNNHTNINIQLTIKGQEYFIDLHEKGEF